MGAEMAGYSGTPLPQKLGIKPGSRFGVFNAPADVARVLGPLPVGVAASDAGRGRGPFDVMICFVSRAAPLEGMYVKLRPKLAPAGGLWIAWPKKASGVSTDVTEGLVRETGLACGLVDNKVCAIDDVWSGLRFVIRLADRPRAKTAKPR